MTLLLICFLALLCVGFTPRPPRPKLPANPKAAQSPTAGSAALANIKALAVVPPAMGTNVLSWDYAATNMDQVTNFARYWGASPGTYTNKVLTGRVLTNLFVQPATETDYAATNYVAVTAMGTNGLESLPSNEIRVPALPLTNVFLTVTTTGTNIQRRASFSSAWTSLRSTNYITTNPIAPLYFRSQGRGSNRVFITQTHY